MIKEKPKRRKFRQEDLIASYIHRPLALEIVRLIWNTNITANQITLFRGILNILSLVFFSQGTNYGFVLGFLLFEMQEILDSVDGMYARLKHQTSKIGAYMEYLFDDLFSTSYGLFGLSIAYGAYKISGEFLYIWLFIFITIAHSLDTIFLITFENEKICNKESLHNIDHDKEVLADFKGSEFKDIIKNVIFTIVAWKNELLLWGAFGYIYIKKTFAIDTIFWALLFHLLFFNIKWIVRAIKGFKKAKELDSRSDKNFS